MPDKFEVGFVDANEQLPDLPPEELREWVTMSNALTRASHGLSIGEKRIVVCALSKLDSKRAPKNNELVTLRIVGIDYAETFGIAQNTGYEQLKTSAKKLRGRYISFHDPAFIRKGKPLKYTHMNWMSSVTYHEGEGWIEVTFNPQLLPHIMGFANGRGNFTSYQLGDIVDHKSIYSTRLFELLMRFKSTGWAYYTIEDFCASVDAPESHRKNFGKVRSQIIEPAIAELREKNNMIIDWEAEKLGRKVVALTFNFKDNPQQILPL
jgi:plasmid replication initiation protein